MIPHDNPDRAEALHVALTLGGRVRRSLAGQADIKGCGHALARAAVAIVRTELLGTQIPVVRPRGLLGWLLGAPRVSLAWCLPRVEADFCMGRPAVRVTWGRRNCYGDDQRGGTAIYIVCKDKPEPGDQLDVDRMRQYIAEAIDRHIAHVAECLPGVDLTPPSVHIEPHKPWPRPDGLG